MPRSKVPEEVTEKLIELVRQNPPLFDAKCPEHKDAQRTENVWRSIATILDGGMGGVSIDWKKKWRNLRDTYTKKRRIIRTTKSGQGAETAKKWKYMDIMNFLDPYIEDGRTDSNVPAPSQEATSQETTSQEATSDEGEDEEDGADYDNEERSSGGTVTSADSRCTMTSPTPRTPYSARSRSTMSSSPTPTTPHSSQPMMTTKRRRSREIPSDMEKELTNFLKQSTKTREVLDKQLQELPLKTAEDVFFESCALRMKALPPAVRSFLQLQISQLFLNAENPGMQVPVTPLPSSQQYQQQQCNAAPIQNPPLLASLDATYMDIHGYEPDFAGYRPTDESDIISTAMRIAENDTL